MKLKTILFASAAILIGATDAYAQDYEGLYGKIGAGLNSVARDRDFDADDTLGINGEFNYDQGIAIISAIGYDYGLLRGEIEFSYRRNDIDSIASDSFNAPSFAGANINGDVKGYTLMTNLLYDFDYFKDASGLDWVTPYIGGGIGITFADFDIAGSVPPGSVAPSQAGFTDLVFDDTERFLAYQGIGGLSFAIAENVALDLEYRYYGTAKRALGLGEGFNEGDVFTTLNSHNAIAALRWNFGAPVAAPAPAPAPVQYKDCWDGSSVPVSASCPPELVEEVDEVADPIQVTVYFDYDKSNLSSEAASLIREAVSRARAAGGAEGVRVVGNTDRSGSSAYNQALSERRARVVRDALIAEGIPAGIIRSQALGETNPAKQTADGVREPLNRRTEITIVFE